MGFPALYMTGYGATASMLGLPDAGLATYSDMVGRAEMICSVAETPLIADADTGYGGLLNVQRTVRGYEAAGVAAIQIEDQEMPKKCGHTPGRRVVPAEEMVLKIKVAAEARRHPETMIVARTDARTALGLDEALRRARLYEEAGADVIFVESPESEAELERIGREVSKPLLANMVEFGKTPRVEAERLKKWGFDLAIYPGSGLQRGRRGDAPGLGAPQGQGHQHRHERAAIQWHARADGFPRSVGLREEVGAVNGKQFLEMLARLPARVWLQAILGLIGFVVLAVLGFAVIAGVAAVIVIAILAFKAKAVDPRPVCGGAAGRAAGASGPQGDRRAVRDRRQAQRRRPTLNRPGGVSARPLEAVDHEVLAGDEAGLRGGEEGHELRHVGGLAQAVEHDALLHLRAARSW